MRKKDEALRETLLGYAKEMVRAAGPEGIHIRAIAQKAGIATGTVYNYFSSKEDILLALTEAEWDEALLEMSQKIKEKVFYSQLQEIYGFLRERIQTSAGLLMGSLGGAQSEGTQRMKSMQNTLAAALVRRMELDEAIRPGVWDKTFTKEAYAQFILMNLMLLLRSQAPRIDFFIEIVKRTLYE